jgi:hypothetical protein
MFRKQKFILINRIGEHPITKNIIKSFVVSALTLCWIWSQPVPAAGLSVGLMAVEEGGDIFRPGATAVLRPWDGAFVDLSLWGREFGKVVERSGLIAAGGEAKVKGILFIRFGGSILAESTTVKEAKATDESLSDSGKSDFTETSYAPGFMVGSSLKILNSGPLQVEAQWNSHVYPAGFDGGLLLAHGRRQTFTILGGIDL